MKTHINMTVLPKLVDYVLGAGAGTIARGLRPRRASKSVVAVEKMGLRLMIMLILFEVKT